jgi:uncharacterized damage-inducible protein DinB
VITIEYLRRLFAYDAWANREVLNSLRAADAPPGRALERFAHVLSAEELWLSRLRQQSATLPVWPPLTLSQCEMEAAKLPALWLTYLDELAGQPARVALEGEVTYKNSAGQTWSSRIEDVLMHVIMHSGYHRGQIAADLRASGFAPAHTDFILSIRQGFVE